MDRLSKVLTLDLLPNLGIYRLNKKLNGQCPLDLFSWEHTRLTQFGFNAAQITLLKHPPQEKLAQILTWLKQQPMRQIVSYFDAQYPALLKEISAPPLLLFCQGDVSLLNRQQIAIVGSRTATISGRETARRFAFELARSGMVITSGLATGIDSYAHQGALAAQGKTIAVLGSGLDNIYPKSNTVLAERITEEGLLLSELWPQTAPLAKQFPRRNRIVSGLSLGVVIVEAADRSGSLITARLAAEQNREVFAVPGSINNPKVAGCHKLINQGAKLITTTADILDELPSHVCVIATEQHKNSKTDIVNTPVPFNIVLDSIGYETTSIDQIVCRSNVVIEQVLEQLLLLELDGLIASTSGGYIRIRGDA